MVEFTFRPACGVAVLKINLSGLPDVDVIWNRTPNTPNKAPDLRWIGVVEIQASLDFHG